MINILTLQHKIHFMLFKQRQLEGIRTGKVTLAFRKWKSTELKRGSQLKTSIGLVEITDIAIINEPHINEIDAEKAGFPSLEALMHSVHVNKEGRIYKIHVRYFGEDPRVRLRSKTKLGQGEISALKAKLLQLDKYSRNGFWTRDILLAIEENPKLRAADLATKTGKTKEWLKLNIRKLKNLGLTVSHDPGYELSDTGRLFIENIR